MHHLFEQLWQSSQGAISPIDHNYWMASLVQEVKENIVRKTTCQFRKSNLSETGDSKRFLVHWWANLSWLKCMTFRKYVVCLSLSLALFLSVSLFLSCWSVCLYLPVIPIVAVFHSGFIRCSAVMTSNSPASCAWCFGIVRFRNVHFCSGVNFCFDFIIVLFIIDLGQSILTCDATTFLWKNRNMQLEENGGLRCWLCEVYLWAEHLAVGWGSSHIVIQTKFGYPGPPPPTPHVTNGPFGSNVLDPPPPTEVHLGHRLKRPFGPHAVFCSDADARDKGGGRWTSYRSSPCTASGFHFRTAPCGCACASVFLFRSPQEITTRAKHLSVQTTLKIQISEARPLVRSTTHLLKEIRWEDSAWSSLYLFIYLFFLITRYGNGATTDGILEIFNGW